VYVTEFEQVDEASLDTDPDPEIIAYNGSIGEEKYTKIFIDYNNTGEIYPYKYIFFKGETMGVSYDPIEQAGMVWVDTNLDGVNDLVMWVKIKMEMDSMKLCRFHPHKVTFNGTIEATDP